LAKTKAMKDSELSAVVADAERDSLAYLGSKLSKQRKEALQYYLAEPFPASTGLQPVAGRSSVVMQEVADTIDWIMPDLLKKFASGDRAVEFEANHEEGEEAAQQATAYINYVFFHDNPGFMILHDKFQDALIQKTGIVKVWWDDKASDEIRTLDALPHDAYALLLEDPDIEIIAHTENAAGSGPTSSGGVTADAMDGAGDAYLSSASPAAPMPPMMPPEMPSPPEPTHDARYRVKSGKCCVENVPPEEFLMARDGKTIKTTPYCAHRTEKTLSDLIAMGFSKKTVMALPSDDDASLNEEAEERRVGDDDGGRASDREGVMRKVWLTDHYILVDFDGDGVAERRRVLTAGSAHTILENKPWDGQPPFAAITPKPKSHRFFGRSVADVVMDLQRIKSMLTRQLLDNLYLSNNPRNIVSDKVNLDDLMSPRLGSFIRLAEGALPGEGHVMPQVLPFVAQHVIPVLEHFDSVKENRTGVTKYNQGTDSDSLNKTARGISQIMSAAQQRVELIARIFAETGVSDMFMLIMQCVAKYQKKERIVKVAGKWVPIDPRGWESMFKMQINVGLGTGNKDQQLMHLQTIGEMQEKIALAGNPGGIVQPGNVYNVGRKMVENAGLKDAELYFTDPGKNPQQEPPPDPAMMIAQEKTKQIQMQTEGQAQKQQGEQAAMQMDMQMKEREAALQEKLGAMKIEQEQQKMELEKIKAMMGLEVERVKAGLQLQTAEIGAEQQERAGEMKMSQVEQMGAIKAKQAAKPKPGADA
jgi:hypothetical protein